MASEWVEDIKKELFDKEESLSPPPTSSIPTIPEVKKPLFDKYSQNLFLLALSLSIFLVAVYQDKTGVRVFDVENWNVSEKLNNTWTNIKNLWPKAETQPEPKLEIKPDRPVVVVENKDLEKLKAELEQTKTNLINYVEKQRLLAIVINNNAAAVKHGRPNDIIILNRDWTIPHLPALLFLEAEDIEFLNKFLNTSKI